MSIAEIILSGVLLFVSILVCIVTLSMDKTDNNLSVITGLSPTMLKNNKNNIKYTKNKIVIACMVAILAITIVMMIFSEKGML